MVCAVRKTSNHNNNGAVHKYLPRFKGWAARLLHDELAEKFAKLLIITLNERKKYRGSERRLKDIMRLLDPLPKTLAELKNALKQEHIEKSEWGKKGSANRAAVLAKPHAKELWDQWQDGKTRHKSAAAFDRHVTHTLPDITSTDTVKRWRTKEWGPQAKKK